MLEGEGEGESDPLTEAEIGFLFSLPGTQQEPVEEVAVLTSFVHLSKINFKTKLKNCYQRQRGTCDKRVNPSRRYNNYKHICSEQQSPKYMKQNLTELKREINSTIGGDLTTSLSIMDRIRQKISKEIEELKNTINQ